MDLVESGAMPLRPGVQRLVQEAMAAGEGEWGSVCGGVELVVAGAGGGRAPRVPGEQGALAAGEGGTRCGGR